MLFTELKPGDSVNIGGAVVTLIKKLGAKARLSIEAPPEIDISFTCNKSSTQTEKQEAIDD